MPTGALVSAGGWWQSNGQCTKGRETRYPELSHIFMLIRRAEGTRINSFARLRWRSRVVDDDVIFARIVRARRDVQMVECAKNSS